jgi:hypothetical protein
MRFLLFIAVLAVGFVFITNSYQNIVRDEIVETIPQGVVIDPNAGLDNTPVQMDTVVKVDDTLNKADEKALQQIQENINKANEAIKEIEKKNEETAKPVEIPKIRLSQNELYDKAKSRVVNFFCYKTGGIRVASGVMISSKGHILTNAHVAEGFEKGYECMIRQGSPARSIGYAKLIMYPAAYANSKTRQEQAENDVSLWIMSKGAGEEPMPESFPYYDIDEFYFPETNQPLATFSYPSELLGYETLLKSLNMLFAETIVSESDINFILSTSGLSSQIGSSGGVLVDVYKNRFAGIIFGVSNDETISKRMLFSLTPNSVARIIKNETGQTLSSFLNN